MIGAIIFSLSIIIGISLVIFLGNNVAPPSNNGTKKHLDDGLDLDVWEMDYYDDGGDDGSDDGDDGDD